MKYEEVKSASERLGETRDCSVKAFSIATGIPYAEMHSMFKRHGRKDRCGTYHHTTAAVVCELRGKGFEIHYHDKPVKMVTKRSRGFFGEVYMMSHAQGYTMKTIGKRLKRGNYVIDIRNHHAALVDGVVQDWTEGRRHRVVGYYEIKRPEGK